MHHSSNVDGIVIRIARSLTTRTVQMYVCIVCPLDISVTTKGTKVFISAARLVSRVTTSPFHPMACMGGVGPFHPHPRRLQRNFIISINISQNNASQLKIVLVLVPHHVFQKHAF